MCGWCYAGEALFGLCDVLAQLQELLGATLKPIHVVAVRAQQGLIHRGQSRLKYPQQGLTVRCPCETGQKSQIAAAQTHARDCTTS